MRKALLKLKKRATLILVTQKKEVTLVAKCNSESDNLENQRRSKAPDTKRRTPGCRDRAYERI